MSPPKLPPFTSINPRKGKLAVATLCLQDVSPNIYLNQQHQLQYLNNHPVNHRSSYRHNNHDNHHKNRNNHNEGDHHHYHHNSSGFFSRQLRSRCKGGTTNELSDKVSLSAECQLRDENDRRKYHNTTTMLGSCGSLSEHKEVAYRVCSARTKDKKQCRVSAAGCSSAGRRKSEGCPSVVEESQDLEITGSLNCLHGRPLTLENGVYEGLDLKGGHQGTSYSSSVE
ncbi:putative uncharacterized protein DDB_G0272516 [Homarus americanus]|uniref:putative uncharacterized protein DDB_G0272516 n=1 Tax=Homarus americanus TaxID=6706 RepID=UPI001C4533FA|nr:putative uncharacterized protein DDB_G0272516 [Homarus americanus]